MLGAEAEGLVCEMVPILLRVKIVHVLIDKHSGVRTIHSLTGGLRLPEIHLPSEAWWVEIYV